MRILLIALCLCLTLGCVSKETACSLVKVGVNVGLPLALDNHVVSIKSVEKSKKYIEFTKETLKKTIIPKLKDGKSIVGMAQIDELMDLLQKKMSLGEKMAIQIGVNLVLERDIKGQNKSWNDVLHVAVCFFEGVLNVFERYQVNLNRPKSIIFKQPNMGKGFSAKWKIVKNLESFKK
jgi:hypothetical protein